MTSRAGKNAGATESDITAVPQRFSVDPKGKVAANSLRGEALQIQPSTTKQFHAPVGATSSGSEF